MKLERVERSLTQDHPVTALFVGAAMIAFGVAWWQGFGDAYAERTRSFLGLKSPIEKSRWYKFMNVQFFALFSVIAGVATVIAALVNLI